MLPGQEGLAGVGLRALYISLLERHGKGALQHVGIRYHVQQALPSGRSITAKSPEGRSFLPKGSACWL